MPLRREIPMDTARLIETAAGRCPADLVIRNAQVVDVFTATVFAADVAVVAGRIAGVGRYEGKETYDARGGIVAPGLIDAHVHVESSLLSPPEFGRLLAPHGTTAVVSDPHEIANVLGVTGIRYMLAAGRAAPIDIHVMLSSCVPASHLESAAGALDAAALAPLLDEPGVLGLAEMMNFPGVVGGDPAVLKKLALAAGRVVDGHAPGLRGAALQGYVSAGIGSDHECTSADEAAEKLRAGLMIFIREGSQARNLDALLPLVGRENSHRFCFCTDDKYADDLCSEGSIDHVVRRAVSGGLDACLALRIASWNAAQYFRLGRVGAVAPGYDATMVVLDDLRSLHVRRVYRQGRLIAADGQCVAPRTAPAEPPRLGRTMNTGPLERESLRPETARGADVWVIEALEDSLLTRRVREPAPSVEGRLAADPSRDLAKLVVFERHHATGRVGVGLVRGFGLRRGALASSVAHDAHNLVVVGVSDDDILAAAQHLARLGGGLCAVAGGVVLADLPLPIAGLMSDAAGDTVAAQHARVRRAAAELGDGLRTPFMALSFLSLSVIPSLKLTDLGLIDVEAFRPIPLAAT